jgi:hypothetical protein
MARSNDRPDESMGALAAAAVGSDPELQRRVRRMMEKVVQQVEFTLTFGTQQEKAALMKAIVPAMFKSMAAIEDDASEAQKREAYERIREELGGDS